MTVGSECGFGSKWISGRAGPSYSAPVHAAVQLTTEQVCISYLNTWKLEF